MCQICECERKQDFKSLENIQELHCWICPLLTSIPSTLVNLQRLSCSGCLMLTSIPPTLVNLQSLDCYYCPLLTSIPPTLVNLQWLKFYGCPLLTSIPPTLVNLQTLYCFGCPFIYIPRRYKNHKSALPSRGIRDAVQRTRNKLACRSRFSLVLDSYLLPPLIRLITMLV